MTQMYLIIQKEKNNRIVQALCKVNIWLGNLIYVQNYNYSWLAILIHFLIWIFLKQEVLTNKDF